MRSLTLDEMIDRYEAALANMPWREVNVSDYIPSTGSPEYWPALVELLRIRMEYADAEQTDNLASSDVAHCVEQFPGLLDYRTLLAELAFEEYRLRRARGQRVDPLEYQQRWQIDIANWHGAADDHGSNHNQSSVGLPSSTVAIQSPAQASSPVARPARTELQPGEVFGPFRIVCQLGVGALARVYLAQQLDLSERTVVLKVCSQATMEPQKIAMLQHPHIVQIFSVHEVAGFQVLCMPYAGAMTLADFLKRSHGDQSAIDLKTSQQLVTTLSNRQREVQTLVDDSQRRSGWSLNVQLNVGLHWPQRWHAMRFEEVVTELVLQVARGLAHAHQMGIVHSDLKPANILVGDDGQARLVDFNVAQQMADANQHLLGGTLPYMAPEHLQSLLEDRWLAGPSSDLYSLGIIASQLLSSRLPFEPVTGPLKDVLEKSIQQRTERQFNYRLSVHDASADMRSIIHKLIQPDAADRYATADQLCEDLERHAQHRALKHAPNRSIAQRAIKWARRHPRLSSATSVAVLATMCLFVVATSAWFYRHQLRREQADQMLNSFRERIPAALVNAASYRNYHGLVESVADSTDQLLETVRQPNSLSINETIRYLTPQERDEIAQGLLALDQSLNATAGAANNSKPPSQLVALSQASHELAKQLQTHDSFSAGISSNTRINVQAELETIRASIEEYNFGRYASAIERLEKLVKQSPQHHAAWLLLGVCYSQNHQLELADAALASSITLMPGQWQGWFYRGQLMLASARKSGRPDQYQAAFSYFTQVLELRHKMPEALFNRGLCLEQLGKNEMALQDIEELLVTKKLPLRAHLVAARLNHRLGRKDAADAHIAQAKMVEPASARDYVYRGTMWLASDRPQAAKDFRRASELDPDDPEVLQSLALLLMEIEPNAQEAQMVLDRWVELMPSSALALASRGVQRARNGQAKEALADAQRALKSNPTPRERAQIASIFIMLAAAESEEVTSKRLRSEGLNVLAETLQLEWKLVGEIRNDPDMSSVTSDPRFKLILQVATAFSQLPSLIQKSQATSSRP